MVSGDWYTHTHIHTHIYIYIHFCPQIYWDINREMFISPWYIVAYPFWFWRLLSFLLGKGKVCQFCWSNQILVLFIFSYCFFFSLFISTLISSHLLVFSLSCSYFSSSIFKEEIGFLIPDLFLSSLQL